MPSVLYWAGVGGGTEHYRCRTPGSALSRQGWTVDHVSDGSQALADVVVLQRVLHPDTPVFIQRARSLGCRVVYDIDDWYDGLPDYNPASKEIGGDELAILHACLSSVDVVTVSTPELADGYGHLNETVVLPNYLDPDVWTGNDHYRKPRA